jgi:hypothetical protein
MSKVTPDTDGPRTEAEFAEALADLVLAARENGTEVLGSWVVRDENRPTDVHVEFTRLAEE